MSDVKEYYDEVPYFSAAFSDCSPVRIHAIARFLGLNPPTPAEARVLEFGCSYGGNILPFAVHNEYADVVGIDISSTQVSVGNKIAKDMGIGNFSLMELDILKIDENEAKKLGKFDYIIAHGVYSWVDNSVKEALLRSVKLLLSANGVAYISYNIYPGWKSLDVLRDFMLFASDSQASGAKKLEISKRELDFLQDYLKFNAQSATDKVYRDSTQLLATQLNFLQNIMKKGNDYYVLHDFLEICNDPTYFYKFAKKLEQNGLYYLLDCSLDDIFRSVLGIYRFDAHIARNYPSRIQKEQMNDFLLNRSFRKSLVIHEERLNGSDDLDIELGMKELGRLNFALNLSDPANEVQKALVDAYPDSLNLDDLLQCTGQDAQTTFMQLMEVFATQNVKISANALKSVRYQAGKSRLRPRVAGYLSYFAKTDEPVILLADGLNLRVGLTGLEARIALKFNGENSFEDIVKLADILIKNCDFDPFEGKERNLKDYVKNIQTKLENAYFFEKLANVFA
ncbi:class I SAM-dependent methyltransferase [Campylobacter curvus]|uniref:class I SAM-dependent methyltransferase n=1 Tax=Campylobacter curvus TaxID=200 RepID=UPI0014707F8D|nr:class I SAM-dependent methyltransferase [Campylobacter curvus]